MLSGEVNKLEVTFDAMQFKLLFAAMKLIVINLSHFIWSNDLNKHINGNDEKAEVKMVKQITSLIVDYFN